MTSASCTLRIVPSTIKCSGKNCEQIINLGTYKGNLCEHCMIGLRYRGSLSASSTPLNIGGSVKPPSDMFTASPPVQPESSLSVGFSEDITPHSPSAPRPRIRIPPNSSRSTRSSFAIPHQPLKGRSLRTHPSTPDLKGLPSHFNSRGELVHTTEFGDVPHNPVSAKKSNSTPHDAIVCKNCNHSLPGYSIRSKCPGCGNDTSIKPSRSTCTSIIIPVNSQVFLPKSSQSNPLGNIDIAPKHDLNPGLEDDGTDDDLDNTELIYPENTDTGTAALPTSSLPIVENNVICSSNSLDLPGPLKRLKTSHPEIIDLTRPEPILPESVEFLDTQRTKAGKKYHITSRSLKLCSTDDCTGIVSTTSFATRCLNCVRRDWRLKRSALSAENEQSISAINSDVTFKNGLARKKGVTWADEVPSPVDEASASDPKGSHNNAPFYGDSDSTGPGKRPATSTNDERIPSILLRIPSTTSRTTKRFAPKVRLIVKPIHNPDAEFIPSEDQDASSPAVPVAVVDIPSPLSDHDAEGWDSDLTELSDSVEQISVSEYESKTSQPPMSSSGFKIRIPPRPGGVHIRKCGSSSCDQLLDANYRWKSCVMCRARSRDYQRKRQNLQGRHLRLDQELMLGQNVGTPLAGDFVKDSQKEQQSYVALVPSARLCSIRNCTHILPSAAEYRWKMCFWCRLCRKEKKRRERLIQQYGSVGLVSEEVTRKQIVPSLVIKALSNPPLRKEPCAPDRCQNSDCGVLLEDSKSYQCKQCIARCRWLMKQDHGKRSIYIERPRRPSPYPEFKCFSALLQDFKGRLGGFLHVQSIFFLFKHLKGAKAMFSFDGEFSVVALDFDLVKRKEEIDEQALKYKQEIEYVGRIKFNPKRLISILDGGGIAVRFVSQYSVPILQVTAHDDKTAVSTCSKNMQCELEIANLPDQSHPFIPGQRTIIRFRLLG